VLTFRWPNPRAPGGAWLDVCTLSRDGKSCSGRNQNKAPIAGVKISGGDLTKLGLNQTVRKTSTPSSARERFRAESDLQPFSWKSLLPKQGAKRYSRELDALLACVAAHHRPCRPYRLQPSGASRFLPRRSFPSTNGSVSRSPQQEVPVQRPQLVSRLDQRADRVACLWAVRYAGPGGRRAAVPGLRPRRPLPLDLAPGQRGITSSQQPQGVPRQASPPHRSSARQVERSKQDDGLAECYQEYLRLIETCEPLVKRVEEREKKYFAYIEQLRKQVLQADLRGKTETTLNTLSSASEVTVRSFQNPFNDGFDAVSNGLFAGLTSYLMGSIKHQIRMTEKIKEADAKARKYHAENYPRFLQDSTRMPEIFPHLRG